MWRGSKPLFFQGWGGACPPRKYIVATPMFASTIKNISDNRFIGPADFPN